MARVLVLYDTRSGHTAAMAELVERGAASVEGAQTRRKTVAVASAEDLFWADGVAAGSPVHVGLCSAPMKAWWDSMVPAAWGKIDGKIGCAFASAGGRGGGAEIACQSLATIMLNFGMLVFGVPDYTGAGQTLHYGAVAAGMPAAGAESDACALLGRRLAEWCAFIADGARDLDPRGGATRARGKGE